MPKTLTASNVKFENVPGGAHSVRTQLLNAAGTVVVQATSAPVTVPADTTPVPTATTPTVTVS